MKALFLILLLFCSNVFAFDSSSAYNVVAMSFPANQMIFNRVVLDSTQKAQNSVTFTADVQNGGGRPTHTLSGTPLSFSSQTDSAFIRMRLYDTAGTLINTVTSPTYTLRNLGSDPNNQFSVRPGDNLHPWTLASVTYTGDLSNVRFIQLEMVGTDGAFWAGNYGPMWRVPTVTFGANATNTVYNPEFGVAPNSVRAQGWFNSSNNWAVCGVTSGNVPCVTSVAGVNANMWGGGYDINGGSLAGTAGGYNGTLSSTTADNAAATGSPVPAAPPPPAPTPIYFNNATVRITNIWPTSNNSPAGEGAANAFDNNPNTKYLNFDKQNAGVTVKLNAGRVVNGFTITTANDFPGRDPTSYKLYGSNDGVTWVLIQEGNLALSDDRFTTTGMVNITNSVAYAYYYIMFPTTKAGTGCGLDCNSMQIAEITYYYDANNATTSNASGGTSAPVDPVQAASGPTVQGGTITQNNAPTNQVITSGSGNDSVLNSTQQTRVNTWTNAANRPAANTLNLDVNGASNTIYIEQVGNSNTVKGIGEAAARITGSSNTVTVKQGTAGAGQNEINLRTAGDQNSINITQARDTSGNQTGTNGHYQAVDINGYQNTLITQQSNTTLGSHYQETTINGNQNNVTKRQTDNGNKIMFTTVTGNNNTVNAVQQGTGQHRLSTNLTGNNNSALVTQEGTQQNNANIDLTNAGGAATLDLQQSGGKNFTIIQSCTNPAGCSTTIRQ